MRDRGDRHPEIFFLVLAEITEHLAEGAFRFHGFLQRHDALDDHLRVGRHHQVAVFGLHHFDGFAAHAAGNSDFVHRLGFRPEAQRDPGAADHPDDRVLAQHDGQLRVLLPALLRRHQHFPVGLVGFRVHAELARALDLAAVGAVVRAHLAIHHEMRAGIHIAPAVGRVGLDERELRDVDFVALQHHFFHRGLAALDLHRRDFRVAALVGPDHLGHVGLRLPVAVVIAVPVRFQPPDQAFAEPVRLHVADDRALHPLAVHLDLFEDHGGRGILPVHVGHAVEQGRGVVAVLVDTRHAHDQAVGLHHGHVVANRIEGRPGPLHKLFVRFAGAAMADGPGITREAQGSKPGGGRQQFPPGEGVQGVVVFLCHGDSSAGSRLVGIILARRPGWGKMPFPPVRRLITAG